MVGGRHTVGRTSRVALRDYVYRPRKARIELAAYAAHIKLPFYFGSYEWSIPVQSIAVVDLTAPGSPRAPRDLEGQFQGRTITYLFTTARGRTATTLLLFAEPQRVPPLRLGPALDPTVRRFLPFGYFSSRRREGAWVDGVLLRVDEPREAVDRLVAAGALRGVYRDGEWRVDRGEAVPRPAADPPWARRSVDHLDGASRALLFAAGAVGWNLPILSRLLGYEVDMWDTWRYLDADIPRWAWALVAALLTASVACRLVANALYRRAPTGPPPPAPGAAPGPRSAPGRQPSLPPAPPARPPPARPPPTSRPPPPVPPGPLVRAPAMEKGPELGTVVGGRRPTRPGPPGH